MQEQAYQLLLVFLEVERGVKEKVYLGAKEERDCLAVKGEKVKVEKGFYLDCSEEKGGKVRVEV